MANHEHYMRLALKEAEKALEEDEVPVGAVIVHEGHIIARAHNQRERLKDPTAHAEMIAITQAAAYLENWRLEGVTLYVTKEPCIMCAGAMVQARLTSLVFGAFDEKGGACGSVVNLVEEPRFNHQVKVTGGVLAEESAVLLREFFQERCRSG
ncbi:MAG TPA: tRNA adenosine(34) deaminase TadA [Candidatus Tripitaka californicus]|uniref:tRNA adenosine(34) deaminase TadA n=1 Tax=Candidatus Tripitaka californicus TaxID=3367616 RepID=UPI0040298B55